MDDTQAHGVRVGMVLLPCLRRLSWTSLTLSLGLGCGAGSAPVFESGPDGSDGVAQAEGDAAAFAEDDAAAFAEDGAPPTTLDAGARANTGTEAGAEAGLGLPGALDATIRDATTSRMLDGQSEQSEAGALLDAVEGECVSSLPLYSYALEVDASGLAQAGGAAVHVYTRMRLAAGDGATCATRTRTEVEGGGFAFLLSNLTDGAAYPEVVIWIDVDGDGACDPDEDLLHSQFWTALHRTQRSLAAEDFDSGVDSQACDPFAQDD